MLHAISWSSFFDILLPAIAFTELNKKELKEINGEWPSDIKEWFLPSSRDHFTKRMLVWERVFYLNLLPMGITMILGWLGLTTGPSPIGWLHRIWIFYGLSNLLIPIFLFNAF